MSSLPSQPANLSSQQIEELHALTIDLERAIHPVVQERAKINDDQTTRQILESIQAHSAV